MTDFLDNRHLLVRIFRCAVVVAGAWLSVALAHSQSARAQTAGPETPVASGVAQSSAAEVPVANPARPTVATPATLTPVGYLQFENGGFYGDDSPEFAHQFSLNQVTKLTMTPRLQLLALWGPLVQTSGVIGDGLPGNHPGDIQAGAQAVVVPGDGVRPTLSLSYIRDLHAGSSPDIDIGSFRQSGLFLWSEDLAGFHIDANGIFSEQVSGRVRRGQFGQTLSVSHAVGAFTVAGELWHFTQPLTKGNAVGNLWALSYSIRKNLVVDAGFNRGLTSSSTQWEGFGGFTYLLPHRLWKAGKEKAPGAPAPQNP